MFPSLALAREVSGTSNLRLVLDTFHLAVSGTPISAIQQMDAAEIGLIHLSDAIVGDHSVSDISDEDRVLPGEGELPLLNYLGALADIGYVGPVSVEVFHPKYADIGPGRGALEAHIRARSALASAGLETNLDSQFERGSL